MRAPARAKVNLTLHILRRSEDGFHHLDSLVAFAGVKDWLSFTPGPQWALTIKGEAITGAPQDNLILRGACALAAKAPDAPKGAFVLQKNLPIAAGLGGGSADAAAALRLIKHASGLKLEDQLVIASAQETGSDVPVCLTSKARRMGGRGEILGPLLSLAPLPAVLVNPRLPLATTDVFAALHLKKGEATGFSPSPDLRAGMSFAEIILALKNGRNDLQSAAILLLPEILTVLDALKREGALLARMSGSGPTCFALFADCAKAAKAAKSLRQKHREWWIKATLLR